MIKKDFYGYLSEEDPLEGSISEGKNDQDYAFLFDQGIHYWSPIYFFLRTQGFSPEKSEELTQGFFFQLANGKIHESFDPENHRLRPFMYHCCKNFQVQVRIKQKSFDDKPQIPVIQLKQSMEEISQFYSPQETYSSPEQIFNKNWAVTLLKRIFKKLKRRYKLEGNLDIYASLKENLTGSTPSENYNILEQKLQLTAFELKEAIELLRKRYLNTFQLEIFATVPSEEQIEEEMILLMRALNS